MSAGVASVKGFAQQPETPVTTCLPNQDLPVAQLLVPLFRDSCPRLDNPANPGHGISKYFFATKTKPKVPVPPLAHPDGLLPRATI